MALAGYAGHCCVDSDQFLPCSEETGSLLARCILQAKILLRFSPLVDRNQQRDGVADRRKSVENYGSMTFIQERRHEGYTFQTASVELRGFPQKREVHSGILPGCPSYVYKCRACVGSRLP
jgi:hypothetical protein